MGLEKRRIRITSQRWRVSEPTINVDLIRRTRNPMLAVVRYSRGINEVNHIRVVRAGSELQGKEILVEAHDWRMGETCANCAP